jgi:thiamine biosynthesis lipoprotein
MSATVQVFPTPHAGLEARSVQPAMGGTASHDVAGSRARESLATAEAELLRMERLLSRFRPSSEVSAVNRAAGSGEPVPVGADTCAALGRAAAWADRTGGLLDVTVGPLVELWSRAAAAGRPPSDDDVARARALVRHGDLVLDEVGRTARLERRGQSVDLGAIGRGFAADRVLSVHRAYGIESALVDVRGCVAVLGRRPDGEPWRVGIPHPRAEGWLVGSVEVTDAAVVTSADRRPVLDPRTGTPARSGLCSVTVVAPASVDADALSTAVLVAGRERGLELLAELPGAEAVLVDTDLQGWVTGGIAEAFRASGVTRVACV